MADSERVTSLVATADSSSGAYNLGLYRPKDTITKSSRRMHEKWPITGSLESVLKSSENAAEIHGDGSWEAVSRLPKTSPGVK